MQHRCSTRRLFIRGITRAGTRPASAAGAAQAVEHMFHRNVAARALIIALIG